MFELSIKSLDFRKITPITQNNKDLKFLISLDDNKNFSSNQISGLIII